MRLHALDGLRGLAAVIVLAHHALLTVPVFAVPYLGDGTPSDTVVWALTHTPLHVLWEGHAAVYIFFVLSGLVLTMPVLKHSGDFGWLAYYPQRLARLYVPVWAAIILALVLFLLVPRDPTSESLWLQLLPHEIEPAAIARDATLVAGNGPFLSPLWSLRWEIIFSLLFPLFAIAAVKLIRFRMLVALACLGVIALSGWKSFEAGMYLPMFMIGCLMATGVADLRRLGERLGGVGGTAVVIVSILCLTAPWLPGLTAVSGPLVAAATFGAVLAVFAAIAVPAVKGFLSTRVMQWLGLISFSLYLVHEPIVVASAHLFGDDALWGALPSAGAFALVVAYGFHRWVEVPSHRLARAAGDAVRRATGRRAERHTALLPEQT